MSKVMSPALRTAMPSAKVSISDSSTGSPASKAAFIEAVPVDSTPTTQVSGLRLLKTLPTPAISPPPPIGSRI